MKKIIKPEELPEILDDKTIDILARMANEVPQSKEWHQIFDILSYENLRKVMDRRIEIQAMESAQRKSQMTEEEKLAEEEKKKAFRKKLEDDTFYFYGNMGRPDTPEEFKSRFGVWPDGTDGETYNPKNNR